MKYQAVTVSQLNSYIKEKIAEDEALANVLVKGEISNFKNHYTGHFYFTLKDENSLIKCIMFKSYSEKLDFMPKDGMKVMVFGSVSVFERDGIYQIYAKAMQEDGMGSLYTKYEELKKKLEEEGLFDINTKKKIPQFPKVIGVLTSQTGAVIRDIINVSTRRNPNVYIRLLPVPVQGPGAAEKIAYGIELINSKKLADLIIVARGGGSIEDLWPFNEECVARAIYDSELPVISAVGHETDFTIADFVADLRAPTPSAAAELAVPDIYELKNTISIYQNRFRILLKRKTELMRAKYEKCMQSRVFKNPTQIIDDNLLKIDNILKRMENNINKKIHNSKNYFVENATRLDGLSPLKTLTRGYCLAEDKGKIIKKATDLEKNQEITLRFSDGKKQAKII